MEAKEINTASNNSHFVCVCVEMLSQEVCCVRLMRASRFWKHTLTGKGTEGCVTPIPTLRTALIFPCSSTTPWLSTETEKKEDTIFSNGCYDKGKIAVWCLTDQVWSAVLSWYEIVIIAKRECETAAVRSLHMKCGVCDWKTSCYIKGFSFSRNIVVTLAPLKWMMCWWWVENYSFTTVSCGRSEQVVS